MAPNTRPRSACPPESAGRKSGTCWNRSFTSVVNTGEAFWAKDHLFGLDRHGYVEETYFDVSYDPVRDETGRVGGLFCIVSETTGRILGERRLAALRDLGRVSHSTSSVDDVFRSTGAVLERYREDLPFVALYSNDTRDGSARLEAATGVALSEVVTPEALGLSLRPETWPVHGDSELALVEPRPGVVLPGGPWPEPVAQAAVLRIGARKEPYGYLVAGISARRRFDDDYAAFLHLIGSNIANTIASVRALEDERRRAATLAELDRAKTTFFSNVSHEFRTPLTLILGPLQDLLARAGGTLPAPDRGLLATALRNGQRLLKLVNTLLDFARIEAGRSRVFYQPTDLPVLTADLASNFRSACEQAGLALRVECEPVSELACVDRDMWEQIVLNLLSNAFKFTLRGGISVRLQEDETSFVLVIADTGVGVPADALPRIFERFHQVKETRGRSHEGSGIGLALVSELVKLHGGTIAVASELGHGTTFTVTIPKGSGHLPVPLVDLPPERAPVTAARADVYVAEALGWLGGVEARSQPSHPPGTPRLLVADDNVDLREHVRRLLSDDYEIDAVADGQAALETARRTRPDLIISDVMMPGLDGFGLIRELRADPDLHAIPVILLSARAGEDARLDGLGQGADDYLIKPFTSRELLVRVGAILRSTAVHRQAAEALREADSRKDEFLATLAHELRNPLAPLRSSLEVLKLTVGNNPALDIMERQLSHLVRLVDDLMEVSRITRGEVELRKESVRLDVAIRNALEVSDPLIRAGRHHLRVSIPADPIVLEADPIRLAQVFGNLLNNAAKYSDAGGTITVEVRRESDDAVVTISDTGDGIDPGQLPQLFRLFARGGSSAARNQSGLGIGLALVRRLIEMHGGQVGAESQGLGLGSRFTVRLPVAPAPTSPSVIGSAAADQPLAPTRILVVDDNRDAAESLGLLLGTAGADIRVAYDGPAALASFAAWRPDVILLDIGMPGMDGYEVARRMRLLDPESRASIVALTGWGQSEDRKLARDAGFDHHLVKPVDLTALKSLIASIQHDRG